MNNENSWYHLDLDISNAFKADYDMLAHRWSIRKIPNPSDIFAADWLKYMGSRGIPISGAMMFHRPIGDPAVTAHIDVRIAADGGIARNADNQKPGLRAFAINWVIGGRDSEMSWYRMPERTPDVNYTSANTPYIEWPVKELVEIDRCCIQSQPTMVRVDVPHAISVKDEARIAISVRSNGIPNDWNSGVNYLRYKKILIER
jgi:hypothetical protein